MRCTTMRSLALVIAAGIVMGAKDVAAQPTATVTKVIDSGSDGLKLNIAVLGDGYAAADQQKYNDDVDRLLISGVFANDFFKKNRSAFNVYRVNLVSKDSGVTHRVYDEHNTPFDRSDDTVASQTNKDTALKFIWSGSWAHCWLEFSPTTEALLDDALSMNVPTFNYVLVVLNQDSYGGCGGSGRQYIPRGVTWDVISHEYGHGIGALADEYFNAGTTYTGGARNGPNVSTILNRNQVAWHDLILTGTAVATNPATPGIDANTTVGEFLGGGTFASGMYRPVDNCRMRSNTPNYCPVCTRVMSNVVGAHLTPSPSPGPGSGPAPAPLMVPTKLTPAAGGPTPTFAQQGATPGAGAPAPGNQPPAAGAQDQSYLHMVLRVNQAGQTRVVSAVEVAGPAVVPNARLGDYAYEVTTKGDKPVVLRSVPDPFEGRSFPSRDPNLEKKEQVPGEHVMDATIVVKVPNTTLDQAIANDLAINRLDVQHDIPATDLGPQLKKIGRRLGRR
jgi:hypothetical protein